MHLAVLSITWRKNVVLGCMNIPPGAISWIDIYDYGTLRSYTLVFSDNPLVEED